MAVLEQLIGQVLDEKYRIDKQLGQGGMGAVFLATHLGTGRPVALKVIAPQFMANTEFVERFKREAKAAGLLRHPNVVNVTDFGFSFVGSDRLAYLVMEYLNGCNLSDLLRRKQRLPLGFVVDIVEQTCLAIDEAHRQGIIHRDLKPDNIWLEPNSRGGYNVKVLDFGLAKLRETTQSGVSSKSAVVDAATQLTLPFAEISSDALSATATIQREIELSAPTQIRFASDTNDERTEIAEEKTEVINRGATAGNIDPRTAPEWLTRVGTVLGTPLYMSPEQCRGETLDARADIYSLGVITYQMLAGQTPFTGDMYQLILKHNDMPPPPLIQLRRDIPKSVAALVMSALAKNPAERPASAAAFASALLAHAFGIGTLLRQAITHYSEHFPIFISISLIGHIPWIVFMIMFALNRTQMALHIVPRPLGKLAAVWFGLLALLGSLFATAMNAGAFVLVVAQLVVVPLRAVQIRPIFFALKKRLRALVTTTIRYYIIWFFRLFLLVIPGVKAYIDYSLYAPVVMMEGLEGHAALARSQALVGRLWRTVVTILAVNIFIYSGLAATLTKLRELLAGQPAIVNNISGIITYAFTILSSPLFAILFALLYLKTRQASGETLREILGQQFEGETLPISN